MRALALLAAVGFAHAGCIDPPCNEHAESSIVLEYHYQHTLAQAAGSTVRVCLNYASMCSTGTFGAAGTPTATQVELDGDFGPVTALLGVDSVGVAFLQLEVIGGNGRYHDGDTWVVNVTEPGGGGFSLSTPVTYVSHPQPCGGPGSYQTLTYEIAIGDV